MLTQHYQQYNNANGRQIACCALFWLSSKWFIFNLFQPFVNTGNFICLFPSFFFFFDIFAWIFTWHWQVESFLEELHFIQLKRASFSEYIKLNYLIKSNAHPLHNINSVHSFHVHCAWHTFWELSYNSQYQQQPTISKST